jgi:3-methylfumaryl-CoA hydratase
VSIDIERLRTWIGKSETRTDIATAVPVAALAATLDLDNDLPQAGDALPPLWHWLYFLPLFAQSEIGADGHPKRGGFLPPIPLPRRMWAGGRLEFMRPLRIGEMLVRMSEIADVSHKQGRSGELVFVLAKHAISDAHGIALTEEHDIVYREAATPGSVAPQPQPAPVDHTWMREIHADPVLLFRYSALTFNGHRIHYDRKYVTEVEGYPGLVVHGPLIATLLMDLLQRNLPQAVVKKFSFRAVKPLFDLAPFVACGKAVGTTVHLWAKDADGHLAMDATAELA